MSDFPFISVVIPARNAASTLPACLGSLARQNHPSSRFEVLIIDGGSTDETATIAHAHEATVLPNPKISIATGRNLGVERARGDLIAFTDADCVLHADWLRRGASHLRDGAVAGVTGPIHLPASSGSFAQAVDGFFALATVMGSSTHAREHETAREVDDFPSCNAIYRAEALRRVMPVDETLYSGSDVAINYQLRQLGYRLLWASDVEVWHEKRSTLKSLWRQMTRYAIGRVQLGKRWSALLKSNHVLAGLALPLWLVGGVLLQRPGWGWFGLFVGLTSAGWLAVAGYVGWRSQSMRVMLCTLVVTVVFGCAWCFGFWREWLFPMRRPQAN